MSDMITEHYLMDVPKFTEIVEPEEHAGKIIQDTTWDPWKSRDMQVHTDKGTFTASAHFKVKVKTTPEREDRLAFARMMLGGM